MIYKYISFFILMGFTIFLLLLTFITSFNENIPVFIITFILIICFLFASVKEFFNIAKLKIELFKFDIDIYSIFFVFLGGILTYFLNINLELGAVVSSCLIGLGGSIVIKKYSVELYCGSFVGMISPRLIHDFTHIFIASLLAGLIFSLSKYVFDGFGGKLGAIAFSSWFFLFFFSNIEFINPVLDKNINLIAFILSFLGVFLTFLLNHYVNKDPVISSAFITLIGAMILPFFYPTSHIILTPLLFTATFSGMASKERIYSFLQIVISSFFVAILFYFSFTHLGGVGGKLGTIAFGSIIGSYGFFLIINKLKIILLKQ